ncbi:IS21-like element helper ATPase IstB [Herbivorax sp. ANBcel31]|uniref:IS21-like element helper ATPase IstB n=1 Tax=Herbivorax sp. ANBcel31 TaxID=3069754 RepID=UPI0027ADE1F5|nr:IS21-like element helper ATPase IstB [Herbivorax sp. ANBcel31]MDQ2088198.1 IS21-like element helper ATPase IstB [Herbivorax sp. ANBcel31]
MNQHIESIKKYAKELKLKYILQNIEVHGQDARNPLLLMQEMLEQEYIKKLETSKQNRIKNARFPFKKLLEELNVERLPPDAKDKLGQLETLQFIENKQNIILAGLPGTGKSHIAIGLGIKACNAGYKTFFTTTTALINRLKESRSEKTLQILERQFMNYDLIIIDELGYISFDKEGSELLFSHLSLRAERKSTIITTNLKFNKWHEIFKDPLMTTAMVDRLTHKSFLVDMDGDSYRMYETLKMIV